MISSAGWPVATIPVDSTALLLDDRPVRDWTSQDPSLTFSATRSIYALHINSDSELVGSQTWISETSRSNLPASSVPYDRTISANSEPYSGINIFL